MLSLNGLYWMMTADESIPINLRVFICTSAALNLRNPLFSVLRPLFWRYCMLCNSLNIKRFIIAFLALHLRVSFILKFLNSKTVLESLTTAEGMNMESLNATWSASGSYL